MQSLPLSDVFVSKLDNSLSGIQNGGDASEIKICNNTIFNCGGIAISATFKNLL